LFRTLLSLWLLAVIATVESQSTDEEIVVEADPFLLRIAPKPRDLSLEKRVTVLWTVENIVREFFEDKYKDSEETLYIGAGITGLSLVPPDENTTAFETIKFLGGAVAFHPASRITPNKAELQGSIKEALRQDGVKTRLRMYFPSVQQVIYVPLVLGNRGFAVQEEDLLPEYNSNDNLDEPYEKPVVINKPSTSSEKLDIEEDGTSDRDVNAVQGSSVSYNNAVGNSRKTTVGLATGVALGGAIIVLLVALLIESRRRRMDFWREPSSPSSSEGGGENNTKKEKASTQAAPDKYYMDDEQETTLRLPRIWGVSPSQRMESRTTPGSSDISASNEGDSIQEILTCTSMDRRSIRNVESFEHQKRLVDTLKKEMMASNAEIHPYMLPTSIDNTEPCALSPTDLSAAALENEALTRPVSTWHAPSDSSFTGSGSGSGYDSPSSPLGAMMGALHLSSRQSKPSSSRRLRSPYEPDRGEL